MVDGFAAGEAAAAAADEDAAVVADKDDVEAAGAAGWAVVDATKTMSSVAAAVLLLSGSRARLAGSLLVLLAEDAASPDSGNNWSRMASCSSTMSRDRNRSSGTTYVPVVVVLGRHRLATTVACRMSETSGCQAIVQYAAFV